VGGAVCMSPKSSQQSERTLQGSKSPYLYCARMPLSQNKAYFMQLTEILPSLALELENNFSRTKVRPNWQHKFHSWCW